MMTLELHAQLLAQTRELNLTWQAGIRWFCCSCVLVTIVASRRSNSGRNLQFCEDGMITGCPISDAQTVISDRAHRSLPDTPVDRWGAAAEVESRWTSCARLASSGLGRGAAFEFSLQSGTGL